MLITKEVEIELNPANINHYEKKGYIIPKYKHSNGRFMVKKGTKIIVDVYDLPPSSKQQIEYLCDYCLEEGINNIIPTTWGNYNNHKNDILNKDACMYHSTKKAIELGTRVSIPLKILPKEEIANHYLKLASKVNCIPKLRHIKDEIKINLDFPSIKTIVNVFGGISGLKEYCKLETQYFKHSKEELLNLLIDYINKNGIPKNIRKAFNNINGLPAYKTYVFYFGDNFLNLIELCGFKLSDDEKYDINKRGKSSLITKEEATQIIFNMKNKLERPLMYDDFRNPDKDELGITQIKKFWGSMNKMKEELGLEIIQENMLDRQIDLEEAKNHINRLCLNLFKKENRVIITYRDIDRCSFTNNPWCYNKIFLKELGMTLRKYVQSIGFDLAQEGNGLNHEFEDGEKTRSQYELDFSIYLRDTIGLKYNVDYWRDVKYKTFIPKYTKQMNCDYVIDYKGRKIYIEIAGVLRDYQDWYYQDKPLNSKSKEKYRLKLKEKEIIFKESGVEYYILFPSDLKDETYKKIFN